MAGALAVLLLSLLLLPMAGGAVDITFSDNNLISGYSVDIYTINATTGNTSFIGQWNSTVVTPFTLNQNLSYIGIIRQSQVARFNNMNELGSDALDWVAANYIGLFIGAMLLLIVFGGSRK